MEDFTAMIVFVFAWVATGYGLDALKVKSRTLCMAAGAILGMMLAYYYAYFGG